MFRFINKQAMKVRGSVAEWLGCRTWNLEIPSSCSDHHLDLFEVVPGSTPRLCLYKANWSASCQLGFLNLLSLFQLFVSLALKSPNGGWSIKYINYIQILFNGIMFFLGKVTASEGESWGMLWLGAFLHIRIGGLAWTQTLKTLHLVAETESDEMH